ncbi:zinc finger family protein [Hibiscus syriacus]|uniref:Zinc finger family protein n=1 Tax=Hibiscus syriacus TaxID=106335 RepID=A0A6A2YSD9_HIBSY|nr:zinc finger family protein [Hibiscus syriacus]
MENNSNNVAIVFGVTGLVGRELAKRLISKSKWKVYGVARNPEIIPIKSSSYHFISCDLLDPFETEQKISMLHDATHVFWVTWARQFPLDTPECWMSHYVPSNAETIHLFDEEWSRPSGSSNFYYVLEDLLHERLGGKVAWTVHRPGLLMGGSNRTLFNFIGSLCVYGSICKHLNLPFVFGGSTECWEESYIDGSDARVVAEQQIWATTACEDGGVCPDGEAFNAINGSSFTWKEIWPILGKKLGVRVPEEMVMEGFWFGKAMGDKKKEWEEIVVKERLVETKMEDLANWEFLDTLFRLPANCWGPELKSMPWVLQRDATHLIPSCIGSIS